jgi:hypothetical protein
MRKRLFHQPASCVLRATRSVRGCPGARASSSTVNCVFSFPVRDAGKRKKGGGRTRPMRYGGMPTPFRQKASPPLSARYANGSRVGERTAVRNKEAPRYDRSHVPDNARQIIRSEHRDGLSPPFETACTRVPFLLERLRYKFAPHCSNIYLCRFWDSRMSKDKSHR